MSVLHTRLSTPQSGVRMRLHGTSATPMMMPIAVVDYSGTTLAYSDLHPVYYTGDVNGAPVASVSEGGWGWVAPAGQP